MSNELEQSYIDYAEAVSSELHALSTNREIILTLFDMDDKQRAQLKTLVGILPPDFPHKKEWIE
jgi:hypothetical protein